MNWFWMGGRLSFGPRPVSVVFCVSTHRSAYYTPYPLSGQLWIIRSLILPYLGVSVNNETPEVIGCYRPMSHLRC